MKKLRTEMISYLRKECYDVFDENDNKVGYIQYSAGTLTCHPVVNGNTLRNIHVYWWQGGGIYDKNLPLDKRDKLLECCTNALIEYFNKKV